MSNSFDFEEFKVQTIEKLKAGVPLSGKNGVLAPLLEKLLKVPLRETWIAILKVSKMNWTAAATDI